MPDAGKTDYPPRSNPIFKDQMTVLNAHGDPIAVEGNYTMAQGKKILQDVYILSLTVILAQAIPPFLALQSPVRAELFRILRLSISGFACHSWQPARCVYLIVFAWPYLVPISRCCEP